MSRCDARVASGGYSFRSHQCCRNAKVSDSTGNWCTQHDPKRKLTRMHAQQAEWAAERANEEAREQLRADTWGLVLRLARLECYEGSLHASIVQPLIAEAVRIRKRMESNT